MSDANRTTVIYDGTCPFCTRSVQRLQRAVGRPFEALPSQSDEAHRRLPELGRDDFDRQMYAIVDGEVYGGAEAIARVLMTHPLWRAGAWIYYVPGLRQAADALYRQIAARRHCLGGRCELPGPVDPQQGG